MDDSINFVKMISVEQLIGELLLRHNCVVIPSFGGFVAKKVSATIDFSKGAITPPRKSLLFNRQLVNNDGLLVSEFARINQLSYNDALTSIETYVAGFNAALRKGERITIDKVGFLYFDQEKNICFEQDRFFNLLLESYGLGSVHFVPQQEEIELHIEEKKVIAAEGKTIELPILTKEQPKLWKYVAAACILPIAFYSFWLPVNTKVMESGLLSVKDFNPFYNQQIGIYKKSPVKEGLLLGNLMEETSDDKLFSTNGEVSFLEVDKELSVIVQNESNPSMDVAAINSSIENESFDLIVGCFSNSQNAENFILSLKAKGVDAYLYDMNNGLRRISAGHRNSKEEADALRKELEVLGVNGWILKK